MDDNDFQIITDIDILIEIKENLKNDILDPNLEWKERLDLYQAIKNINQRIKYLSVKST